MADESESEKSDPESSSESESEYSDPESSSDSEDEWEVEENEKQYKGKSLLWLVQEGLMPEARLRFDTLHASLSSSSSDDDDDDDDGHKQLQKQIYQVSKEDGNYPLHEILMGGTQDSNARSLATSILEYGSSASSKNNNIEFKKMLSCQPKSHKRTCLHWAVWSNSSLNIIQRLVREYPEALMIEDAKDKGQRTPLAIYNHYHMLDNMIQREEKGEDRTDPKLDLLTRCTISWTKHRLRLSINLAAHHIFVTHKMNPFDKKDRKQCEMKPRPWFVLSVLGYFLQREMKPLFFQILSFVGRDARESNKTVAKRKKTNKRKLHSGG